LASRIVVQFVGQIFALGSVHARPALRAHLVFRMPLFPLPALVALAGWIYVFVTLETKTVVYGVASLIVGVAAFAVWDGASGVGERFPDPGFQIEEQSDAG